jgi:acyl-CoA thioester hydrolase
MARIDRDRLTGAELPIVTEVPTRFADLDGFAHVNNAAAPVILQEARYDFSKQGGMVEATLGVRVLVGALYIEYVGEMFFPGIVEVRSGILRVGRTSAVLGQIARQDGRPVLFAETVLVAAGEQGPQPIPAELRAVYERQSARWT